MKQKESANIEVHHICNNFDNFFIDFMKNLEKLGISNRVYYPREMEKGIPEVSMKNLIIRLNHTKLDKIIFKLKTHKIYRDFFNIYQIEDVKIIHAHTLFTNGQVAYKINKKFNIPYIVAVRSTDIDYFLRYRKYLYFTSIKILKKAEKIIFISHSSRKNFIKRYRYSRKLNSFLNKSVVIPNGVNDYYLENLNHYKKKEINNKVRVLTVGYIGKRKNQLRVCQSLECLKQKGMDVSYTIIGKILDDRYFSEIESYDFVKYKNYMSKERLLEEFREADIYVMPSISETFGITYIEALTQGVPIVYLKNQGVDGFFENCEGPVGIGVNDNAESIVKAIKMILQEYPMYSDNATYHSKSFNWLKIQEEYVKIYQNILETNNY